MAELKTIIIGCGLAGALLGNGLMHNGIPFTIYESDAASSNREGYQIRLGAPALMGFRACLSSEQQSVLYKTFGRSGGVVPAAPRLFSSDLKLMLDLTKFPAYTKSAPINRVVLRNFLREPLEAADKIRFGKKFTRYQTIDGDGDQGDKVKVFFEDGTQDVCDLLISAEGSVSRINSQVGLDNIVPQREKWSFLAKGSLPLAKLLSLPRELRDAPMVIINNGLLLFCSGTCWFLNCNDTES